MLGTMFYKGIAGITSMQAMTDEFNKDRVVKNLYRFMGGVYYGKNVPLFRRNGYRKPGAMIP